MRPVGVGTSQSRVEAQPEPAYYSPHTVSQYGSLIISVGLEDLVKLHEQGLAED